MSKGDFYTSPDDVIETSPPDPCESFGHSYEIVTTDVTERVCNDCGDRAVVLDTECIDKHREWYPEHKFHFGECVRCGAEAVEEPLPLEDE